MKNFLRCLLAAGILGLVSCAQPLPDVADFDRYQEHCEQRHRAELEALNRRRAAGQLSEADYARERADLEARITAEAHSIAWTNHNLREIQRESHGLPSPDQPIDLSVPEAGSLPTGTDFRRFNQRADAQYGSSGDTMTGMRQMMGSNLAPGSNIRQPSRGGQ